MSDTKIKGEAVREQSVAHGDQLREAAVARARGLHEAAVAHAGEVMEALRGTPPAAKVPVTVVAEAPAVAPLTVVTPPEDAAPPASTETSSAG